MKSHHLIGALLLIATAALGGCANTSSQTSTPYYAPSSESNSSSYGVIEAIQLTTTQSNESSGAGAVVGGLVGALVGNQIGSGTGRTVATVAGAVGGAVVGNNVEKNRSQQGQNAYQIQVRMNNGERINVVQDSVGDLRVGNRVRVINGRVSRY